MLKTFSEAQTRRRSSNFLFGLNSGLKLREAERTSCFIQHFTNLITASVAPPLVLLVTMYKKLNVFPVFMKQIIKYSKRTSFYLVSSGSLYGPTSLIHNPAEVLNDWRFNKPYQGCFYFLFISFDFL